MPTVLVVDDDVHHAQSARSPSRSGRPKNRRKPRALVSPSILNTIPTDPPLFPRTHPPAAVGMSSPRLSIPSAFHFPFLYFVLCFNSISNQSFSTPFCPLCAFLRALHWLVCSFFLFFCGRPSLPHLSVWKGIAASTQLHFLMSS